MKSKSNILKPHSTYTFDYPKAIEFAEQQADIFWTDKEIALEKDLHDLKTVLTEQELHGVTTVLKLFTEYELKVGTDYWLGRVMRLFKRPEIQRMAAVFGAVELGIHAPFYSRINELLGLNTDEFYESYTEDPVLNDRMKHIEGIVGIPTKTEYEALLSLGAFSILEGAILYSNFAFLKHFQAEGKNKLMNLVGGINFSVRDENLHSLAGAWLFQELLSESSLDDEERHDLILDLTEFCNTVLGHEQQIIEMIFEKGPIRGITEVQLDNFVQSRINLCMEQLGYHPLYEVTYNPIAKWFYKSIQSSQIHDFFVKVGNTYTRDWKEKDFNWSINEGN